LEAWAKEMELTDGAADKKTDKASDAEYVRNTFDFPFGMSLLRRC